MSSSKSTKKACFLCRRDAFYLSGNSELYGSPLDPALLIQILLGSAVGVLSLLP